MRNFRDSDGREWRLRITVAALERARAAGADLLRLHEPRADGGPLLMDELTADAVLLARVVHATSAPAPGVAAVTVEAFLASMDGAAMAVASAAFWEELADFFRSFRPVVAAFIERVRQAATSMSGSPSTDSPASPAASPTGALGAS